MNVKYMFSLIVVVALILIAYTGVEAAGLQALFGIVIPYIAVAVFIVGFITVILGWGKSPVPFRIPTTGGQQKSLPWIKHSALDNPYTKLGVIGRMILEIALFRSLFRNTRMTLQKGNRLAYYWEIWLWLFALAFHYAFAAVVVRHLRFFTEPVPFFVQYVEKLDSFFQVLLPVLFLSGPVLLAAATFLLLRRILMPKIRYISQAADFFPLFLIIAIAVSGILMRYVSKVDIVNIKALAMGLVTFHPTVPEGIGAIFYVHLFLVCVLLIYFPFSKLMHAGGVFMSPTRNLPGNSRAVMHVNPWNYPVKVHTYEEYEDEFRERMIEAGLPVEKE